MPALNPDALDFFDRKKNVPSALRTAEWAAVPAWIRERSFFMAAVENARTLQAFRDVAREVLEGKQGAAQAREAMRRYLRDTGYTPEPGKEGTLQDLASNRRLKVAIDTNVAMARGWQQRQELLGDPAHPALELYRAAAASQPRDWGKRWRDAASAVNFEGVAKSERMVALTESPIWRKLSAFDLPYPPFDFGSHMRVMPVRFSEARELGLFDTPESKDQLRKASEMAGIGGESLNEQLEVDARQFAEDLQQELQRSLKGLVRREGEKLVCTDPNGTKPYNWRKIGEIITAELPEGMDNLQARAFQHWVEDSSNFRKGKSGKREVLLDDGTKDEVDIVSEEERMHMVRLVNRIIPTNSKEKDAGVIYRALGKSVLSQAKELEDIIRRGDYCALEGSLGESWTNNVHNLPRYANKKFNIILRCGKYHSRRRIDGLYAYIRANKQFEGQPLAAEGESIMPASARFGKGYVVSRKENKLGGYDIIIDIKEI